MSQTVYSGVNSYKRISDIIKNLNVRKPMLVCGKSFDQLKVKGFLENLGVKTVRFSDFSSNPVYEDVCKGVMLFRNEACDALLAIGGGSAIDVAKCIKLFSRMDPSVVFLDQEYVDTNIPIVAMPTTAGTGSESTIHAVIYFNGDKQSVSHPSIIPEYAVLDPSVLKSLPVYQKKCTLMDALCQAIESWWSVNSTDESRKFSKAAVEGIVAHWHEYIEENTERAAEKIMLSSNLAGRAINITATTAPHAMSYKLTSMYKLPHGHAVALCLPEVWDYMLAHIGDCIDKRGEKYVGRVFDEISEIINIKEFRELLRKLELLKPMMKGKSDLVVLSESVNKERLKNNPIALNIDDLRKLYERIVER